MPGTNNFLPFAIEAGANVVDQIDYAGSAEQETGFVAGVAESAKVNKVLRQASVISHALAQFVANLEYDMLDDADEAQIITNITAALVGLGIVDIAWQIAYSGDDVTTGIHGAVVLARDIRITDEQLLAVTGPVGADLIVDIKKNGTSIYSTLPEIADGATVGTAGVFTAAAAFIDADVGDRIEIEVTQTGVATPGQKIMFTLKAGSR